MEAQQCSEIVRGSHQSVVRVRGAAEVAETGSQHALPASGCAARRRRSHYRPRTLGKHASICWNLTVERPTAHREVMKNGRDLLSSSAVLRTEERPGISGEPDKCGRRSREVLRLPKFLETCSLPKHSALGYPSPGALEADQARRLSTDLITDLRWYEPACSRQRPSEPPMATRRTLTAERSSVF